MSLDSISHFLFLSFLLFSSVFFSFLFSLFKMAFFRFSVVRAEARNRLRPGVYFCAWRELTFRAKHTRTALVDRLQGVAREIRLQGGFSRLHRNARANITGRRYGDSLALTGKRHLFHRLVALYQQRSTQRRVLTAMTNCVRMLTISVSFQRWKVVAMRAPLVADNVRIHLVRGVFVSWVAAWRAHSHWRRRCCQLVVTAWRGRVHTKAAARIILKKTREAALVVHTR